MKNLKTIVVVYLENRRNYKLGNLPRHVTVPGDDAKRGRDYSLNAFYVLIFPWKNLYQIKKVALVFNKK